MEKNVRNLVSAGNQPLHKVGLDVWDLVLCQLNTFTY